MGHSYTNLKYHVIFSTRKRMPLLHAGLESEMYRYIGGIIQNKNGQIIGIGGIDDHIHILAGFHQSRSVAGMVGAIKSNSSSFGKELGSLGFGWQTGYSAFSVSESKIPEVRRYIQLQPPQQNLWVNLRSGRSPSVWYKAASRFS
jgi:REP element-mobilizing transposase RayT